MVRNISTFLANDHGRLLGLFREYQEVGTDRIHDRRKRFNRFRRELERHGRWVGSELVTRIRGEMDETHREKLNRFLQEEKEGFQDEVEAIEEKLSGGDPDTREEEAELLSSMRSHFTREEKVLYPMFDQYLTDEEQQELIETFQEQLGINVS